MKHLRFSEGTVWNRLQVVGVARRFPQILEALARGRISFSVAGSLAAKLTNENVDELLKLSEGKSTREVRALLASLDPQPAVRPAIAKRAQPIARGGPNNDSTVAPRDVFGAAPDAPSRGKLEPAELEHFNFRFVGSRELKVKLQRFAEVLSVENPEQNMAKVFERALEIALHHRDPKCRAERRARAETQPPPAEVRDDQLQPGTPPAGAAAENSRSRYVPIVLRDKVLERASHRCEYRSPDGRRCTARTALQIDHVVPYARGGQTTPENLRVLCRPHNLFAAEQAFGRGFVDAQIERQRGVRVRSQSASSRQAVRPPAPEVTPRPAARTAAV